MDKAGILKQSFIFSSLSESEIAELSRLATERRFVPEEFIFWEGDSPEWFYVIAEGKVKAVKHSSQGKEIIIAFFGPGEMFGEVAVFENKPYPASAQSLLATRVLGIRRDDFISFLVKHPPVALRIMSVLSGRLRDAQSRLRDLAAERVEQRLARILVMLSSRLGADLAFTRQELSDMAGTTTETVIRILSQWKSRKILRSMRGKITILDQTKLRLLAEGPPGL